MPLWEGILASFLAGCGVSLINRFALSQVRTPCEKKRLDQSCRSSSSNDEAHGASTNVAIMHCHAHGGGD